MRTSSSTLAIPAPLHRRHPDGASGLVTPSSPTSAHIVAERRHSAITRYAERSVPGLDTPLLSACRRYATTPEPLPDRASGLATPITADIRTHRRGATALCHNPVRGAERSAACRDLTRPCCRRAGGTPLLQSRCPTARAVTLSVNPRPRRGYMHRHTCAAERRRWHTPALHLQRRRPATHFPTASDHTLSARLK